MNIVIESHIPYIKGLLEPMATVSYLPPEEISPQAVALADALLVRTRTRCNEALLCGSNVKFVGTATIGTDHIDLPYCKAQGIEVANAPGCNAPAVAQYVLATIGQYLMSHTMPSIEQITLGIVGVGHVGSIVERWARQLGFNVLTCDPPRQQRGDEGTWTDFDTLVAQSHIITFHTPLTKQGENATWHLCDEAMLARATNCRLIINAARGAVADNEALLHWHGDVAIDCWEGEPAISRDLLKKAFVATPHIAGYSAQGKQRGTAMVLQALNRHFGLSAEVPQANAPYAGAAEVSLPKIMQSYNPLADTQALRSNPDQFEALRNNYNLRNEVI